MADKEIIGLQMYVRHESVLGDRLHVVPARWSERDGRPIGVSSNSELRHLDDLDFGGYVSDYTSQDSVQNSDWPHYHGSEAEYRDVHTIGAGRAKTMADFLLKVEKAMQKSHAREAGDRFVVFAATCKAQYVWLAKGPDHKLPAWPGTTQWVRYSVLEGRDSYRRLIADLRDAMRRKLLGNVKEAA